MFERIRSFFNKPSASFQILSDLHLEINQQYSAFEIPVRANHLILAGDIGRLVDYDNYLSFLQKQTDWFKLVFLALGNHEFYNLGFAQGLERAQQLENEPSLNGRLVLLNRRRYDLDSPEEETKTGTEDPQITILGCTLWSHIPAASALLVRSKIQDFEKIHSWTVDTHNAAHEEDTTWLLEQMKSIQQQNTTLPRHQQRKILVITHHAPSLTRTSHPQHAANPWSSAFGTDVFSQMSAAMLKEVKVWVFGHTHYTTEFRERGVRVLSNQRGYVLPWMEGKSGKAEDGFDVEKVVHV
ncbi:Metallo-dependent phosphatase-like protein [Aspergillus californicus]